MGSLDKEDQGRQKTDDIIQGLLLNVFCCPEKSESDRKLYSLEGRRGLRAMLNSIKTAFYLTLNASLRVCKRN